MQPRTGTYVIGLDHLRALAALLVLFWHSLHFTVPYEHVPRFWVTSVFEEGWVGVSLFICITGFVFTVITHDKDINYFGFLKNRFLRLFPLIFLVTLYGVSIAQPAADGKITEPGLEAIFKFFNLLGGGQIYGTWTLIVEFQFYLCYPFLRDRLVRGSVQATLLNCAGLSLILLALRLACFYQTGAVQKIAHFTIFGQGDSFIAGILAGLVFLHMRNRPLRFGTWFYSVWLCLGVVAVAGSVHWMNAMGGFYRPEGFPSTSIFWVFWPTISAVAWGSILAPYCLLMMNKRGVVVRALAYLGTISYSTYMLHFIIMPLSYQLFDRHVGVRFFDSPMLEGASKILLIYYPATIAVSALSYEIIERAFLKQRVHYLTERSSPPVRLSSRRTSLAAE